MAPKSSDWTFERERVLIEFYANHPSLWDPYTENCSKAENLLLVRQLAVMLDNIFTAQQVHRRFICLRSTFRENYKKVNRSNNISLGLPKFVPSWAHYRRMHFLAATFGARKKGSKRPAEERLCDTSEDVSGNDPLGDMAGEPVQEYEESVDDSRDANAAIGDHTYFPAPEAVFLPSARSDRSATAGGKADVKRRRPSEDESDVCAAFGRQVADSLRAMGPAGSLASARAMMHIQEVLVRFHPDNPDNPGYASHS